MISFIYLSDCARSFLVAAWSVIAMLMIFLFCVRFSRAKKSDPILLTAALLLTVWLVLLMAANRGEMRNIPADGLIFWVGSLPLAVYILIMVLSVAFCTVTLKKEIRLYRNIIPPGAIREAIDDLTDGLGFFETDGFPVLVNHHMYELALELTGNHLQNGEEFWRNLSEFSPEKQIQSGDNPVFIRSDGSVWSFSKLVLDIDEKPYIQITAADITRQYQLSQVLKENNELLDKQRKRLQTMLANIVQLKREEEVLESKVRVHARFGWCVLTTRRALAEECSAEELENILELWKSITAEMRAGLSDAQYDEDNTKVQLEEAAAAVGCKIEFSGALPDDSAAAYLILTAVREAVTNAVRHAGADKVTAEITDTDTAYSAVIYDNGSSNADGLKEGGGLSGLRKKIERAGGQLDIKCENGIRLYVRLLKQRGEML